MRHGKFLPGKRWEALHPSPTEHLRRWQLWSSFKETRDHVGVRNERLQAEHSEDDVPVDVE